ncbi:hypothetical protein PSTT_16674 [Puccinia striiformis]|uniref:CCHC-type domain-containing protein n=1 Tax=Puccinia striiformis TaxID=27350 RepID=A0A2S4UBU3_9BASI|nr:hypothetical protein PSTT_16674 [Puccinia striiformis]
MDESSAEKDVSRTNLPAIPDTSPPSSAFLTFLSGVLGNPNFRSPSGDVLIKQDTLNLIQQMILVEDTRLKKMELHMNAIDRRITLLELNRQPMASSSTQAAKPSYARATGNPAGSTRPIITPLFRPSLQSFNPGKAIIHSDPNQDEIKKLDRGFLVQRANEVIAKLDAQVQGEPVTIKTAQVLKSGDVVFFSKNCAQQKWLMENKHRWTKDVHKHLEATPSSFMIIADSIPKDFNPKSQTNLNNIAVAKNFGAGDLVKMKWLADNSATLKQAGSLVLSLRNKETANRCVKSGIYLNWDHHRVTKFIPCPPQCWKCLKMGHFGQWCREKARCGKCGDKHITKDCPEGLGGIKSCVLCKEGRRLKVKAITEIEHTPFNVSCFFKKTWLEKRNQYQGQ